MARFSLKIAAVLGMAFLVSACGSDADVGQMQICPSKREKGFSL